MSKKKENHEKPGESLDENPDYLFVTRKLTKKAEYKYELDFEVKSKGGSLSCLSMLTHLVAHLVNKEGLSKIAIFNVVYEIFFSGRSPYKELIVEFNGENWKAK